MPALLHHLAEAPEEFLREPRIRKKGDVSAVAVISDLMRELTGAAPAEHLLAPILALSHVEDRNRLRIMLITCWLLSSDSFSGAGVTAESLCGLLIETSESLSPYVAAEKLVSDGDRREELVRTVLSSLKLTPFGESAEEAADRLITISSAARKRAIEASRAAEARAQAIREALAKREAAESADKWSRE